MKKALVTAVILFLSVIPMMYLDQGTSEGRENISNSTVLTVPQAVSGGVNLDKANTVKADQDAEIIASTAGEPTSASAPVPASTGVTAPVSVQTEATAAAAPPIAVSPAVTVSSPSVTASNSKASAKQNEMLAYINAARAEVNLTPLVLYNNLSDGAYLKSQEMSVNGYFSHYSPTYGSPFEMMTTLGINYGTAGENIAKNFSVKGAHDAFMNSPGHKANILNPDFQKVGLGFYQDATYLYVTQWFTD